MNWRWFRKKPVVVQAVQWDPSTAGKWDPETMRWSNLPTSCWGGLDGVLMIDTLEGIMRANPGDWLVIGVENEMYPVKDSIFKATYKAEK